MKRSILVSMLAAAVAAVTASPAMAGSGGADAAVRTPDEAGASGHTAARPRTRPRPRPAARVAPAIAVPGKAQATAARDPAVRTGAATPAAVAAPAAAAVLPAPGDGVPALDGGVPALDDGVPALPELPPVLEELGLPCDIVIVRAEPGRRAAARPARRSVTGPRATAAGLRGAGSRGAGFALGGARHVDRGQTMPSTETELQMEGVTVSAAMVGEVVREHMAEVQYCMTRLPAEARGGTVGLRLTIAPRGTVTAAHADGGPRAVPFSDCLAERAARWRFPAGDAPTEIVYPIVLR